MSTLQKPVLEHAPTETREEKELTAGEGVYQQDNSIVNLVTGVTGPTAGASSSREYLAAQSEGGYRRRECYGYANTSALASYNRPPLLRFSLVREVLREIRNLFRRIEEIQNRYLDRRGILINLSRDIPLRPEQQETALACCIQDMRNLYTSRPHASLIDAELYLQGWQRGAAS